MKPLKQPLSRFKKVPLFLLLMLCLRLSTAETMSDFSSDGCSHFPDGTLKNSELWCDCCIAHDKAYWQGGTQLQKLKADKNLRDCVLQKTGNIVLADTMYYGVILGGTPLLPTDYRWGFGWSYGRSYQPLSFEELRQVKQKLRRYQTSLKAEGCPLTIFELPLWFHTP